MSDAGQDSPHLDEQQQEQAKKASPLGPLVIHEIVREQGEIELERDFSGLAWSGLASGLSIGFSFVAQSYLKAGLPDAPWSRLVAAFGYSVGFLIVVLGRQQLFTETTLTAVIPALTRRNLSTILATARVWAIVLRGQHHRHARLRRGLGAEGRVLARSLRCDEQALGREHGAPDLAHAW